MKAENGSYWGLDNFVLSYIIFQSLQKFDRAFFFKLDNPKLKMSMTWKCFDGIERTDISISDVSIEFRF